MKLQSGWTIRTICCTVLAGLSAAVGTAQSPKAKTSAESYLIKLKAPEVGNADEAAIRARNVVSAAVYWDNLYNVGKVSLLGSAQDGDTTYRVVIVEGVNEDEARTIARCDPNVRAGAVTAEVIPLHVDQTKNSQSRSFPARR